MLTLGDYNRIQRVLKVLEEDGVGAFIGSYTRVDNDLEELCKEDGELRIALENANRKYEDLTMADFEYHKARGRLERYLRS